MMTSEEAHEAADQHLGTGDVIAATLSLARAAEAAEAKGQGAESASLRERIAELAGREVPAFVSNEDYLLGEVRYLYHLIQALLEEDRDAGREQAWGSLEQLAISQAEADLSVRRAGPPEAQGAPSHARENAKVLRALLDQRLMAAMRAGDFEIPVASMTAQFGLSDVDWMILLAVLAPAIDPNLLRLYRKCWKDFTRRRPEIWFVSRLLDERPAGRRAVMRRLGPGAPLVRHGLITTLGAEGPAAELLPFRELAMPPSVADRLQGHVSLDPLLVGRADLWQPAAEAPPLAAYDEQLKAAERLRAVLAGELPGRVVVISGPRGSGRRTAILAAAKALSRPVLSVRLRAGHAHEEVAQVVRAAGRDALLHGAVMHFELEEVGDGGPGAMERLGRAVHAEAERGDQPIVITCARFDAELARELPDAAAMTLVAPTLDEQIDHWRAACEAVGLKAPSEHVLREAGCRQGLTPRAIAAAAVGLRGEVVGDARPSSEGMRKAVRLQLQSELGTIARHLSTRLGWTDIILPDETIGRLMDIVTYARYRKEVFDGWGFAEKYQRGQGMVVLLSGPSGTGKSTVAALLAREIGIDIYQVDLSRLVSKWVGETEKNLARIFDEAERIGAALLFDEADSVFGKRTTQSSGSDRYANLETNYLLQRVEEAQSLVVLTTNYPENMDDAFMRRILFDVKFAFPDAADRERLWRAQLPSQTKVAGDVRFDWLAAEYELSGGRIRNAVLNAAFRAAERDGVITLPDFEEAAQREYRAMGRLVRKQTR
ncbi:MAG: ATP-binding protein [Deltaproteobacteria bacterium]|nr:ATP-binding protein [Deltaproteobacteria bacterium]